ncbi:PREDICTED: uncharacterized protein LOC109188075 [Ipomoea nil]|uniref:uncharacterized protein LOC109188075 n=1 Tax=Ipomoea nil TaxID=35883 RepID=UPI000901F062|nr:PREDICTED: uncharacterized protein LOC109188075 [Ipomoea nil]
MRQSPQFKYVEENISISYNKAIKSNKLSHISRLPFYLLFHLSFSFKFFEVLVLNFQLPSNKNVIIYLLYEMAEMKDAHVVVEIPVDEEHQQKKQIAISSAIQHHPLMEISRSPGHLLLLKLWQREEELFGRRIAAKETRLDFIRREIFQLCCFFFTFHGFFFTILFTSYSEDGDGACRKWWIPSAVSACTSLFIAFLVQMKLCRFWKMSRQLQRERNDSRAVTRCIQELRMKGESFDLSKEPLQIGKRMKSSSVEIKWRPLTCCSQYAVTVCLVCFAGLLFPASRFLVCA